MLALLFSPFSNLFGFLLPGLEVLLIDLIDFHGFLGALPITHLPLSLATVLSSSLHVYLLLLPS